MYWVGTTSPGPGVTDRDSKYDAPRVVEGLAALACGEKADAIKGVIAAMAAVVKAEDTMVSMCYVVGLCCIISVLPYARRCVDFHFVR